MKKKSVYVIIAVAALVLVLTLFVCLGKKPNNDVTGPNNDQNQVSQEFVLNESDNGLSFSATVAKTEVIEKTFEVSPYQSATITIKKTETQGNAYIDIMGDTFLENLYSVPGENENEEIITIPEGSGKYNIRIDLENFVGSCEISWEVSTIYTSETHTSNLGYTVNYIPEKFEFQNVDGKEKFVLKTDTQDTNEESTPYFMVYFVDAAGKDAEKARIKTADATVGDCIFAEGTLKGEYASVRIGDRMEQMNFMFDLNDGRLLVIEVNQYQEHYNGVANGHIKELISSFNYVQ